MKYPLVTTRWLDENLELEQLIVVDVSMSKVVGKKAIEYEVPLYIPRRRRLDLETTLSDLNSSQIHAFPTEDQFTAVAQQLGVNSESIVVFYDNQGVYSAPRAWWIFQVMLSAVIAGYRDVVLYDGSWSDWGSNVALPVEC